nr:hypothetical protein [Brucella intermedia]
MLECWIGSASSRPVRVMPSSPFSRMESHAGKVEYLEFQSTLLRRFKAFSAGSSFQTKNADAGSIALFRMGSPFNDAIEQETQHGTNSIGFAADFDGPPLMITLMVRWHGEVIVVWRPLLLSAYGQQYGRHSERFLPCEPEADFDLPAREAVGNRIKMTMKLDMIINPNTAAPPFGMNPGFSGKRF